jgi:hypothetical protein
MIPGRMGERSRAYRSGGHWRGAEGAAQRRRCAATTTQTLDTGYAVRGGFGAAAAARSISRARPARPCLSYERRNEEAEDRAEVPADVEAVQARVRDWNDGALAARGGLRSEASCLAARRRAGHVS